VVVTTRDHDPEDAQTRLCEQLREIGVVRARPARPATPYERRTSAAPGAPGAPGGRLPPDTPERVYPQVPYSEKDLAKQEKARWDPTRKLWYIDPTLTSRDRVARWLPGG
jgi:hypothetical protein